MRKMILRVPALVGLVVVACVSSEKAQDPNKDNAALQVVFIPTCGSPGDRIKIQLNADSCVAGDPANPDSRVPEVVFRPGKANFELSGGHSPSGPYAKAAVSGEARNYTLDLVVPEGAETGTVDIIGCGNLVDELVRSSSVFTIPCPPGDAWAGEVRINYNPVPSPLGNAMATFYKATSPAAESALAELEANVKKQTLGSGIPVGECGEGDPSSPDPEGLPKTGIDVGSPLELRESAMGSAIMSLSRGDNNFYMGSTTSALTPGGSPYFFYIPGGGGVPETTLEGFDIPALPTVTQPAENASIPKNSDYTITFQPFEADAFVVTIGTMPSFKCNIDPKAGSIVVPDSQLSKLPNGYVPFDFRAVKSTDQTLTIDGKPRRITSFRSVNVMIGATLN